LADLGACSACRHHRGRPRRELAFTGKDIDANGPGYRLVNDVATTPRG